MEVDWKVEVAEERMELIRAGLVSMEFERAVRLVVVV